MSEILPAAEETPSTGGTGRTRRMAEVAAVVSAATAVAALIFGLAGKDVSPARHAGAPGGTPGTSLPPAETPSAGPTATATPAPPATTGSAPPTTPPPLPEGWHSVTAAALTASLALPDGWKVKDDDALHVNWISPDGRYVIGIKRDGTHGSTPQAASIGQLAWYRNSAESKMLDLTAASRTLDQGGRPAVRLDLDFRWEGESAPSQRIELFVAGAGGQVYQLLAEDKHPDKTSALTELFDTARAHLLIDRL
ncbi:hypothetical protein [Streptomyces sp. NPDC059874]|uniref:hypothetical protein n=1 Tax=Streptomyces sp. NPDC059874 TaxID=3346983 RepID=UPI0036505E1A